MRRSMKFICFDYGRRRIGVAVGQTITGTAQAETVLNWDAVSLPWNHIEKLIQSWHPDKIVVGKPCNMDGTPHEITEAATDFAQQLSEKFGADVRMMDERLSSKEAEELYKSQRADGRKRSKKAPIDALAAKVILESWMRDQGYV